MCATTVSGRCGSINATLSPRADAQRRERVGQAVRLLLQIPERERAARAPTSSSQYSAKRARSSAWQRATGVRDVELARHVPAVGGVQLGVAVDHWSPTLAAAPLRCPEGAHRTWDGPTVLNSPPRSRPPLRAESAAQPLAQLMRSMRLAGGRRRDSMRADLLRLRPRSRPTSGCCSIRPPSTTR